MDLNSLSRKFTVLWIAIALMFIFISSFYFGYRGQPAEMALAIVAGAIALSFLNIDKIARFKGAGFEAEMKKAVEKAYATTESVRELAKVMAIFSIYSLAMANRYDGLDIEKKHALKQRVDQVCSDLGVQDLELEKANTLFYKVHALDHLRMIWRRVRLLLEHDSKKANLLDSFFSHFTIEADLPSIDEIRQMITSLGVDITPEVEEAIKAYAYYRENKRLL